MSEEIPFHEANLDIHQTVTLLDGVMIECGQDRRVEVWRIKDDDGFCVRIYRPTNDGKIAKLMFGLTPPAARALSVALLRQLSKEANITIISPCTPPNPSPEP